MKHILLLIAIALFVTNVSAQHMQVQTIPISAEAFRFDGSPEMAEDIAVKLIGVKAFKEVIFDDKLKELEFTYMDGKQSPRYGVGCWIVLSHTQQTVLIFSNDEQFRKRYQVIRKEPSFNAKNFWL